MIKPSNLLSTKSERKQEKRLKVIWYKTFSPFPSYPIWNHCLLCRPHLASRSIEKKKWLQDLTSHITQVNWDPGTTPGISARRFLSIQQVRQKNIYYSSYSSFWTRKEEKCLNVIWYKTFRPLPSYPIWKHCLLCWPQFSPWQNMNVHCPKTSL